MILWVDKGQKICKQAQDRDSIIHVIYHLNDCPIMTIEIALFLKSFTIFSNLKIPKRLDEEIDLLQRGGITRTPRFLSRNSICSLAKYAFLHLMKKTRSWKPSLPLIQLDTAAAVEARKTKDK